MFADWTSLKFVQLTIMFHRKSHYRDSCACNQACWFLVLSFFGGLSYGVGMVTPINRPRQAKTAQSNKNSPSTVETPKEEFLNKAAQKGFQNELSMEEGPHNSPALGPGRVRYVVQSFKYIGLFNTYKDLNGPRTQGSPWGHSQTK